MTTNGDAEVLAAALRDLADRIQEEYRYTGGERHARHIRSVVGALTRLHASGDGIRAQTIEECVQACEIVRQDFRLETYTTGQPLSSLSERFACSQCIEAIRRLPLPQKKGGA